MIWRLRMWLAKRLIGSTMVLANAEILGPVYLRPRSGRAVVAGCWLDGEAHPGARVVVKDAEKLRQEATPTLPLDVEKAIADLRHRVRMVEEHLWPT